MMPQPMQQVDQMAHMMDAQAEVSAPAILSEGTRTIQQAIGIQNVRLIIARTASERYYGLRNKITLGLEVLPRGYTVTTRVKDDEQQKRVNFKDYVLKKLGEVIIPTKDFWMKKKEGYGTFVELLEVHLHNMAVQLEPIWDEVAHEVKHHNPDVIVDAESPDMMDQVQNVLASRLLQELDASLKEAELDGEQRRR